MNLRNTRFIIGPNPYLRLRIEPIALKNPTDEEIFENLPNSRSPYSLSLFGL